MQNIEPTDYCWCEQDICILFWRTEISDAAVHIFKPRSFVVFDHDLCNLSTCPRYQIKFVEENGLLTVNQLLTSLFPLVSKCVTMIICNLTSHKLLQDHVSRQISPIYLFDLMNCINLECRAFATALWNLASKVNHGPTILDTGGLRSLSTIG